MKDLEEHAVLNNCAINLAFVEDYDYQPDLGMSLPFVLGRRLIWDGESEMQDPLVDTTTDNNWRLMLFHIQNKSFYLAFMFQASRCSYIIYLIDADDNKQDERYIAKIWMEEVFKENPERRDFYLQVTRVEELMDLELYLPNTNYLILPYQEAKKFFSITLNDGEEDEGTEEMGKYTICLPIQVENVKRIVDESLLD